MRQKLEKRQSTCEDVSNNTAAGNQMPCYEPSCKAKRPLQACKHILESLYESADDSLKTLEQDYLRWADDNGHSV